MKRIAVFLVLIMVVVFAFIWHMNSPKNARPKNSGQAPAQFNPPTSVESTIAGLVHEKARREASEEPVSDLADVFGVVKDEAGSPISGAEVKAFQGSELYHGTDIFAKTLEDGTYSLSGLHFPSAYPYQVVAFIAGYAPSFSGSFYLNDPPKRIDLTLTKGAFLSGLVMDKSHKGIPGAILQLAKGRLSTGVSKTQTETDADGAYVFGSLSPGEYWLTVYARQYIDQMKGFTIASDDPHPTQDFTLEYAGEGYFSGVVLDENDQSLEGVRISGFQKNLGALGIGKIHCWSHSSADGTFYLEGFIPKGSFSYKIPINVSASKEGYETGRKTVYANDDDVLIRLRHKDDQPGSISGRVLEEESLKPITEFQIAVLWGTRRVAFSRFESPVGEFLFPHIEEGDYDLHISAQNRAPHIRWGLFVNPGEEASAGEIKLAKGSTIKGKVMEGETREPLSGAMVYIEEKNWRRIRAHILTGVSTDESGLYRLEGVLPGPQYVLASHPDYAMAISREVQVLEGKEYSGVDLFLGNGGSIEGRISDNGMPLAGLTIHLQAINSSEMVRKETRSLGPAIFPQTDDRGYYREDKLAPSFYHLTVDVPTRLSDVTGGVTPISEVVEILEGRTTTFNIDLCEGGFARGQLVGEEPNPPELTSIQVHLRHVGAPPVVLDEVGEPDLGNTSLQRTLTSMGYYYLFEDICPGNYTITAFYTLESPDGRILEQVSVPVTIELGKETKTNINF